MFGARIGVRKRAKDEAEKPFWISFADLMSALMVLFLVVMSVALASITKKLSAGEERQAQYNRSIQIVLNAFQTAADSFPGLKVDTARKVIDFGYKAQFAFSSSQLSSDQQQSLRAFVPKILEIANSNAGRDVLKRMVVEGFTDRQGTYLSNLNLSLERSQRVLCALFARPLSGESPLTSGQLQDIRELFLVGGYSFNSAKSTAAESRRVEMRIEFRGVADSSRTSVQSSGDYGNCALGGS